MKEENEKKLYLAKKFFAEKLIPAGVAKIKKSKNPATFKKTNPFLSPFQAKLMFGNTSDRSVNQAHIHLRVGSSLATIYGGKIQELCLEVFGATGSGNGFDIEFTDATDGRTKYCQLKAGPVTLSPSAPDAITKRFFDFIKSHGKNMEYIPNSDCVVGVTFGDYSMLSSHYKKIENFGFPVIVGEEFWRRITGEKMFYARLVEVFAEVVNETSFDGVISSAVDELCKKRNNKK